MWGLTMVCCCVETGAARDEVAARKLRRAYKGEVRKTIVDRKIEWK
jgi:hypothetical protein